jgi:hypothetical protein
MPKFLVRKVFRFSPGIVNGKREPWPTDLVVDGKRVDPIAWWPRERGHEIEAYDEKEAVRLAEQVLEHDHDGKVWVDDRSTVARFNELLARPRPGAETEYTSINADTDWKLADQEHGPWYGGTLQTFRPKT